MKKLTAVVFVLLIWARLGISQAPNSVVQGLQDVSVTVRAEGRFGGAAEGSGVIKTTKDGSCWVWTAGHVVSDLRHVREVVDSRTGVKKTVVEFQDAKIIKVLIEDGRTVGRHELDAEVVRYSDSDHGRDLALLRIRKKHFTSVSVQFFLADSIPPIGTDLFHCGSLLGEQGSNSVTSGIVSQLGRLLGKTVFDQTTCTAFPGSSGGIICLKSDGRYVGMLVRGAGEGFNLMIPVREIVKWAKQVGVEFALDDQVAPPDEKTLWSKPIEDSPNLAGEARAGKGFLIRLVDDPFGVFP